MTEDARYPIGKFQPPVHASADDRVRWIGEIEALPAQLRAATADLADGGLDTPYRPGGWTARQVVHHLADSHINAFVRFKLALTEDRPEIKPYREADWAKLADSTSLPPEVSLALLAALHQRWVVLLRAMRPDEFARTLVHPDHDRPWTLERMLALYAWHGRHHVAHVRGLGKDRTAG